MTFKPLKHLYQPHEVSHPSSIFYGKKIGCLIMAGGLATRLGMNKPKGCIPFSPIHKKSLFQIFAEKTVAFSSRYKTTPFLGIMTSDRTHEETKDFFLQHSFFGLPEENVGFFLQDSLPLLDMNGNPIVVDGKPLSGPDGNGHIFKAFYNSPLFQKHCDLDALSIIPIDNPLLDPYHPSLFEPIFHGYELSLLAMERLSPNEDLGLFVENKGKISVIEYSELDPSMRVLQDENGLIYRYANFSEFCCTIEFIKKAAHRSIPVHIAHKIVEGHAVQKREYFIFDHLPFTEKLAIVPIDRKKYFAPIKRLKGPFSLESAQQAYLEKDKARMMELDGTIPPSPIELSQEAYY